MVKYIALALPSAIPSFQISGSLQSGHQRCAVLSWTGGSRGASSRMTSAISATGAAQTTKLARQLSERSGSSSGIVSATGRISPTSKPLVNTAVPKPMRCGSQVRTSGGSEGCMMATPKPVMIVAA